MIRPKEHDYKSHVAYTRALEEYCDLLEKEFVLYKSVKRVQNPEKTVHVIDQPDYPPPDSGFVKL